MIQKRLELWLLLFAGVVTHMLSSSNLNIAITAMAKPSRQSKDKPFVPACRINSSFTNDDAYAAPQTTGEFEWSHMEKNTLLSSFTWLMGVAQLIGGLLCQKYGGKVVFGFSNFSLGFLNFLIPVASKAGVNAVIAVRVLQGITGGAGIGNACNYFISRWVPPHERGQFSATMAGLYFGAAFSYFLNGFVLHLLGWRAIFYITGCITLIWCTLWYFVVYDTPQEHPRITNDELSLIQKSIGKNVSEKRLPVPWVAIATSVPLIVNTVCYFSSMWTTFTFMMYIPTYLTRIHGFPYHKMGELSALPYLLEFLFGIGFASFTDNVLKRQLISITNVRKFAVFSNTIVSGVLFGCLAFGGCNTVLILTLLTIAVMINGANLSGITPNVIDLSPNFCAVIHGMQGLIGASAGVISPMVIAHLISDDAGVSGWSKVFLVTSIINILPGLLFLIFGNSNVQPWNREKSAVKEVSNVNLLRNGNEVRQNNPSYDR